MVLEHLTRLDHRLFLKSQGHRHWQRRARLARWVSRTGDGPPYALLGLLLWSSGQPALQGYVQQALQAFAWELPCYLLLKQLFRRRRPAVALPQARVFITPADTFSFPSGHTAAAFVLLTLLWLQAGFLALWLLPWALLVGWSRVWLGVHFPGDIMAGIALGASAALLAGT